MGRLCPESGREIKVLVTVYYCCWSCGSVKVAEEDLYLRLPAPYVEQWNLCPECIGKEEQEEVSE